MREFWCYECGVSGRAGLTPTDTPSHASMHPHPLPYGAPGWSFTSHFCTFLPVPSPSFPAATARRPWKSRDVPPQLDRGLSSPPPCVPLSRPRCLSGAVSPAWLALCPPLGLPGLSHPLWCIFTSFPGWAGSFWVGLCLTIPVAPTAQRG